LAVKITKMGPEVHAAYFKDKKSSGPEDVAAGGSSAGNTPAVKKIRLLKNTPRGKEEVEVDVCKDPRLN